jgi:hypothetical protein
MERPMGNKRGLDAGEPPDPELVKLLRSLQEDSPEASRAQLRKEFLGAVLGDDELRERVLRLLFEDLWEKAKRGAQPEHPSETQSASQQERFLVPRFLKAPNSTRPYLRLSDRGPDGRQIPPPGS